MAHFLGNGKTATYFLKKSDLYQIWTNDGQMLVLCLSYFISTVTISSILYFYPLLNRKFVNKYFVKLHVQEFKVDLRQNLAPLWLKYLYLLIVYHLTLNILLVSTRSFLQGVPCSIEHCLKIYFVNFHTKIHSMHVT